MQTAELTLGVDEAGRGCVIGPLVVGCVAADATDRAWFSKLQVRDSKIVPPDERSWLAERIKKRCWFQLSSAEPIEIDIAVRDRSRTLNGLELERMSELLSAGQKALAGRTLRAYVDAPSINARAFGIKLSQACAWNSCYPLIAVHRADENHLTVAAASIIAKDERERRIHLLKQELGTDFGCGYPHDLKTRKHLQTCPHDAAHIRWTWKTTNAYNKH